MSRGITVVTIVPSLLPFPALFLPLTLFPITSQGRGQSVRLAGDSLSTDDAPLEFTPSSLSVNSLLYSIAAMESLDDLDDQTRSVVVQLHLDDLAGLKAQGKGKNREGDASDWELAVDFVQVELESYADRAADRAMCESIGRAVTQEDAVPAVVQEEGQAAEDRETAIQFGPPGAVMNSARPSHPRAPRPRRRSLAKVELLTLAAISDCEPPVAESSSAASPP